MNFSLKRYETLNNVTLLRSIYSIEVVLLIFFFSLLKAKGFINTGPILNRTGLLSIQ